MSAAQTSTQGKTALGLCGVPSLCSFPSSASPSSHTSTPHVAHGQPPHGPAAINAHARVLHAPVILLLWCQHLCNTTSNTSTTTNRQGPPTHHSSCRPSSINAPACPRDAAAVGPTHVEHQRPNVLRLDKLLGGLVRQQHLVNHLRLGDPPRLGCVLELVLNEVWVKGGGGC
jgi:hypothetical protein